MTVHLTLILFTASCTVLSMLIWTSAFIPSGQFVPQMLCSSQLQSCPRGPVNSTGVFSHSLGTPGHCHGSKLEPLGTLPVEKSAYHRQICAFSTSLVGPDRPKIQNWTPDSCFRLYLQLLGRIDYTNETLYRNI